MSDRSILSHCSVQNGAIWLNGSLLSQNKELPFVRFMKDAFKGSCGRYPKFYKMDNLSKLAFLTAELIFSYAKEKGAFSENTAMVFANRAASLDTDRKHQESIEMSNGEFTSPAVFVYTLPNICLGEISIRHKLFTEGCFFVQQEHDPVELARYADTLLGTGRADQVLCAWVEMDAEQYSSFAFLLRPTDDPDRRDNELLKIHKETWTN